VHIVGLAAPPNPVYIIEKVIRAIELSGSFCVGIDCFGPELIST
jgi:hypothetical protein